VRGRTLAAAAAALAVSLCSLTGCDAFGDPGPMLGDSVAYAVTADGAPELLVQNNCADLTRVYVGEGDEYWNDGPTVLNMVDPPVGRFPISLTDLPSYAVAQDTGVSRLDLHPPFTVSVDASDGNISALTFPRDPKPGYALVLNGFSTDVEMVEVPIAEVSLAGETCAGPAYPNASPSPSSSPKASS